MIPLTREIRDRRVAVAKDVLAQLAARKLRVDTGYYLRPEDHDAFEVMLRGHDDLQACVDEVASHCAVCIRGALMLSKARAFDAVRLAGWYKNSVDDIIYLHINQRDTTESLADTFDEETLDRLESAFEGSTYNRNAAGHYACRDAVAFGEAAGDPEGRVVACMNNLIANDGEFVVSGPEEARR